MSAARGHLGILMLVHTALERAAEVARHYADHGCPVVIHVDRRVARRAMRRFRDDLRGLEGVRLCARVRVDWGGWSMVEASQIAAEAMLAHHPDVGHVYLTSGSCLPLRPVDELVSYLSAHAGTDFVESVTTDEATWTLDGLEEERFTLRFAFSWRKRRWLFDRSVALQRRLGWRRSVPEGLVPHLGSQWWCLTGATLRAILEAPDREAMDRYFRRVWIPDESYFQTLARRHGTRIDSRSLTLAKFDVSGKPHLFYDDHLALLRRSDCFVARKIWPGADGLYEAFLSPRTEHAARAEPNPAKIDRVFARANERRETGRPGLYNQGRFPHWGWEARRTASRYTVLSGLDDVFEGFPGWFARRVGGRVHGHLYRPDRVEFADGAEVVEGCLTDSAPLRDHRPEQFLFNLLWNTRGERQHFLHGPGDRQAVNEMVLGDGDATVAIVSGAWAVRLMHDPRPFGERRAEAARLQRAETGMLRLSRAPWVRARVLSWPLADVVAAPMDRLQEIVDAVAPRDARRVSEAPVMRPLDGLPDFLRALRDHGVKAATVGDLARLGRPAPAGPALRAAAAR